MEMVMEEGAMTDGALKDLQGASGLEAIVQRLGAAVALLEQVAEQVGGRQVAQLSAEAEASIERIVATAEAKREAELGRKLEFVEAQMETMRASRATTVGETGRRTVPAGMATLLAKQGVGLEALQAGAPEGALDRALASLSIEQRIAVKAQLLRSGAIS